MTNIQYVAYIIGCIVVCAMCLAAGIYLIVTEHYGWAWIPFVLAAMISLNTNLLQKDDNKS
jgi:hypothetical protein